MDFKFLCLCGTKFAFEATPVGGRIPWAVKCPSCGTDATDQANSVVQRSLDVKPEASPSTTADETKAGSNSGAPKLTPGMQKRAAAAQELAEVTTPPPLSKSLLGAFLGGLAGMIVWFVAAKLLDMKIGILAIPLGFLAGCGPKFLTGRPGDAKVAAVASAVAFVLIASNLALLSGRSVLLSFGGKSGPTLKEQVRFAKKALAALPQRTDEEIQTFLSQEAQQRGETMTASEVPKELVAAFRAEILPEMLGLASSTMTDAPHVKKMLSGPEESARESVWASVTWVSVLNFLLMLGAVGLTYKTANH
jgi:hypothetical protein